MKRDVAVIGIGYWGKNLARNYHQLNALHTICDHNLYHLAFYKSQFSGVACSSSFEQILKNPEIKKVVIATPTSAHYSCAKQALLANKDVFIEKAMCETTEQANELVELAKKNKRILMVGHLLHYHPAVARIKEVIQSGELGKLYHASFSRLNFGSRGPESSALYAFAPHDISILLSIAPFEKLLSAACKHRSYVSSDFKDESWLSFEYEEGFSADIHVGWAYPFAERKFVIQGHNAMISFDDLLPAAEKIKLYRNKIRSQGHKMDFKVGSGEAITFTENEPLKQECRHFIECCETRSKPMTCGEEGLSVLKILEALSLNSTYTNSANSNLVEESCES